MGVAVSNEEFTTEDIEITQSFTEEGRNNLLLTLCNSVQYSVQLCGNNSLYFTTEGHRGFNHRVSQMKKEGRRLKE